jgi:hypothetical protein
MNSALLTKPSRSRSTRGRRRPALELAVEAAPGRRLRGAGEHLVLAEPASLSVSSCLKAGLLAAVPIGAVDEAVLVGCRSASCPHGRSGAGPGWRFRSRREAGRAASKEHGATAVVS